MTNENPHVPVPPSSVRRARASRADVAKLEDMLVGLLAKVTALELKLAAAKPDDPELPMSRDYFMALCIISTLQSGGWSQVKYLKARAGQAYTEWVKACKVDQPEMAGSA